MQEYKDSPNDAPLLDWPNAWGEDPIKSRSYNHDVDARLSKAFTTVNKAKDPAAWEVYWTPDATWSHGEDVSLALVALDSCLYRATQGSKIHIESLVRGFEQNLFPEQPIAAWKERWMRDKFVSFLLEAKPDTPTAQLAELALDRWTWAFAWAGQANQSYRHPIVQALRFGNYDLAERMMDKIPAQTWLDWDNPYNMRSIWREGHWRQGDVSWFNKVAAYDPRILAINPKEGMGPLEVAAKEGAADVLDKLLAQGMAPDPAQSFGMTLAHWTVKGLSHVKWNARRQAEEAKTLDEVERGAIACGRTLAILAKHGHGMDVPVQKIKPIPGVRRKPRLPKPPETAGQYLDRKQSEDQVSASTVALVQQAYMQETALADPRPAAVVSRPRL